MSPDRSSGGGEPGAVGFPPIELMDRVGSVATTKDPELTYDSIGAASLTSITEALPDGWSWDGRTVLDFGCGAGRTLRHLVGRSGSTMIWGCDIDGPSVDWVRDNLVPPLAGAVRSDTEPPLPFESSTFDLVYAVSVFTHLSRTWAEWLVELHRVLRPGGLLVATFHGEAMARPIAGEDWDETRFAMSVSNEGQSWDLGGPMVVHSPWWIRSHWGRLFAVDRIVPYGFARSDAEVAGHGIVVARKDDRTPPPPSDLEPPDPELAELEATALHHEVRRRLDEVRRLRAELDRRQPRTGQADTVD